MMDKPMSALARIMSMRATEERVLRDPPLFNPIIEAWSAGRDRVEIVLLAEPDENCEVRIEYQGKEYVMRLSGSILWELRKWACMKRPLKNTIVSLWFRHGAVAPQVDITAGPTRA
jgi:hypothetical protein